MKKDYHAEGTMAHAQCRAIQSALHETGYNLSQAAVALRIGRTTLYRLIKQYDIAMDQDVRQGKIATRRRSGNVPQSRVLLVDGNWFLVDTRSCDPEAQRGPGRG